MSSDFIAREKWRRAVRAVHFKESMRHHRVAAEDVGPKMYLRAIHLLWAHKRRPGFQPSAH
jgi:hypothetical protein